MRREKSNSWPYFSIVVIGLIILCPAATLAAETPLMMIDAARSAIEQAQRAGAEQHATESLSAAKSWLTQAEKAFASASSVMAMISTSKVKKAREEEIIYLATMARVKGQTAEAIARNFSTSAKLRDTKKDLADYQSAIVVMMEKQRQAEMAKDIQTKAETERRHLEESQKAAQEMEAQKRKELQEAQQQKAELEALKQKEILEARLKEAQIGAQRAKEAMEIKAGEEKLSAEKAKLAAVQAKLHALEQEKAMLTSAGKIPKVTAKTGEKTLVLTVLSIHLFTAAGDLSPSGKEILDQIANFLKTYPDNRVVARGHTDSTGKQASNQALSEKRAQKVREYLVAYQNIDAGRITAEGIGSAQPVATNASEAGRALNRRVELAILTGQP